MIPATVKYGGKTFKVTSVAGSALKGKSKVTQVTIGTNVKPSGINSKAKIKVPKKKLSSYKKLLKSKGQGSKVTIVKK